MSSNSLIQSNAKAKLNGFWGSAALATLVYSVVLTAVSSLVALTLLIVGPMAVGYVLYLMGIVDRKTDDMGLLFKGFNNFGNTLVAGILVTLLTGIGMLLLIVPGIWVSLGLSMTYFIMAEDANISGTDAMKMSWEMMKGHKWELFCLYCRFIGWFILWILTLGILSLWVTPYVDIAVLNFYRKLKYGRY